MSTASNHEIGAAAGTTHEAARDRGARLMRGALAASRLSFSCYLMSVFVTLDGGAAVPVGARSHAAVDGRRRLLLTIYREDTGLEAPPDALRSMNNALTDAAEAWLKVELARPQPDLVDENRATVVAANADATARNATLGSPPTPAEFTREGDDRPSQADLLVVVAEAAGVVLWHTAAQVAYATFHDGRRLEHAPLTSRRFRAFIKGLYFEKHKKALRRDSIGDGLGVLEARALAGEEHESHVRIASHDGLAYLDLADATGQVVEIAPSGWRVVADPPVRFRRPDRMLPLPVPVAGGSVDDLRPLVNVPEGDSWVLLVAFLVGAFHPKGPYSVLVIMGEQGSAKSTTTKCIVQLLDPKEAPLRRPPREERDLAIGSRHGRIIALNNVSSLSVAMSDAIAALTTDGGYTVRKNYSDDEEECFKDRRPVIINGIEDFVARGDLADRALKITLPAITERKEEDEIESAFEEARPRILGALLTAACVALANRKNTKVARLPRMADFSKWVVAAESALPWPPGTFLKTYLRAIKMASGAVVEGDPVAQALQRWAADRDWTGSATELLAHLEDERVTPKAELDRHRREKTWPSSSRGLSGTLTRLAPDLRRAGLTIEVLPEKDTRTRRTLWRISDDKSRTGVPDQGVPTPDHADQPDQPPPEANAPSSSTQPAASTCNSCGSSSVWTGFVEGCGPCERRYRAEQPEGGGA